MYIEKRDLSSLTVPSVREMVEDERGYLWIATPGGIVRYDGINPVLFDRKTLDGLPSDDIRTLLYIESEYELWIGTVAGMVSYNLADEKLTHMDFRHDGRSDASVEIIDLVENSDGRVFALTANGIYVSVRGGVLEKIVLSGTSNEKTAVFYDLTLGNDGRIWAVSSDGLNFWDDEEKRFIHTMKLIGCRVIEKVGNELWIGTTRGVIQRYDPGTGKMRTIYQDGAVVDFALAPNGLVWIGMQNNGISIFNPENGESHTCHHDPEHPYSLPTRRIDCLMAGSSGHLWIGTLDAGLLSVDIRKQNHLTYTRRSGYNSLPAGPIRVIHEDNLGYIWAGSDIGGLAKIDPKLKNIRQYVHDNDDFFSISSDQVSSVIEDSLGRIWIGTDQGPDLYISEVDGFEPPGGMMGGWPDLRGKHVLALAEAGDGSIWMSFRSGELYLLDSQDRDYEVFPYSSASVPSELHIDSYGSLWAGSRTNLRLFRNDGKLVETWDANDSIAGEILEGGITALHTDSLNRLWLGSSTGLAIYHSKDEGFEIVTLPGGLGIGVSNIIEDRLGNIWISNGREIHVFGLEKNYMGTIGAASGFTPSGFISSLSLGKDGRIYVGASGEIWSFDRMLEQPATEPPRAYLTGLKVADNSMESGRKLSDHGILEISPGENMIRIEFGAVDFRYQEDIGYEHRLEGYDSSWVDSEEAHSVNYVKIPPKSKPYTFIVRAYDVSTGIRGPESHLGIMVMKPGWMKWWALMLYVIFLAGLVMVFVKLREGRLLKNQVQVLEEARSKVMEANRKLEFLTMNDSLTGLLNRRGFDQAIDHALTTANRNNLMISLFMMDVDFFKLYNDSYGHVKGDEVLRRVGKALRLVFERSTDIIARYGGEEFTVVFIGENPNATVTLANDLILAIQELDITHEYSSISDKLTLSVGSATIRATVDITAENLIERSDRALYASKDGGRKRVCFSGIIPELPDFMKNGTVPIILDPESDG